MILPNDFHQPGLVLREQREILHQVEQSRPVARPAQHHLQRHPARLVLALDALNASPARTSKNRSQSAVSEPTGEARSVKSECRSSVSSTIEIRHSAFQRRVEPKELRNLRLVVRQVLVERRACGHAGLLQFDDHERQTVDEADQIRSVNSEADSRSATEWLLRNGDKSPSARPRICGCGSKPLCASTRAG